MVSLLDIAAAPAQVQVGGKPVDIYGISAKGLAALMQRFPSFSDAILGRAVDLSPENILATGPDLAAALMAAGMGKPGDAELEERAANLCIGDQVELLAAILTATLPGGTKKVLDRLGAAASAAGLSLMLSPTPSDTSSGEDTPAPSDTAPAS